MSKDLVAPKERVNIVYRTAEGDAREEVELPLKLLVLGDFTGRPDERPIEEREPVSIDKENFNEVMRSLGVAVQFAVPNCLSGNPGDELAVALDFQTLSGFGPESIMEQVPELKRILKLREALRSLKGPLANVPEFRRKIHELLADADTRAKLLSEVGTAGR
ncbi:type VI secretion system contractile sheath small subunit [Geomonas sp. Red32]|uniref:type VI secretion system contractile sheath small subunit n=1 Tax=Geomonas sp. Red32 TaxID=2912856 RepID=UPI00202D042F|nr:type VI secretion system contractile sheath small subunit [Geomonas sp. Red32]MCM0082093.1 type VI secretion system contractile sheath small subunit [Geomonas sp. Red32]